MGVFQSNTENDANTKFVNLGRGIVLFAENDPDTGLPSENGFRDFGNVTNLGFNITTNRTTRTNYRGFTAIEDLDLIVSQQAGLTMTIDELSGENIAAYLAGTASDAGYTSPLANAIVAADNVNINNGDPMTVGRWYELQSANGLPLLGVDPSDVALNTSADATVDPTEYEVDPDHGLIRLLTSSDTGVRKLVLAAGTDASYDTVDPLVAGGLQGWLKFLGKNQNGSRRYQMDLFQVNLSADGDLPLIGNEVSEATFTGATGSNTAAKKALGSASDVGRFYYPNAA